MTQLISPPLLLDSTGAPANGEIFARVTASIPADGGIITPAQARGVVTAGHFEALNGTGFLLPPTPEGVGMELYVELREERPSGQGRPAKHVIRRTVAVPDQATVTWSDLVDVVPVDTGSEYAVPSWVEPLLLEAAAAGDVAISAKDDAELAATAAATSAASIPSEAEIDATIDAALTPFNAALTTLREQGHALSRSWAAIHSAPTSPVDILAVGDSMTEGTGSTVITNRAIDLWVGHLRSVYQPSTAAGGRGYIPAAYFVSTPTGQGFTRAGTTSTSTAGGLGLRRVLLSDATATMTLTVTCTSFDVFYSNLTTGTKFSVKIDGGVPVVVTTTASPTGYGMPPWNSGALTAGSHTIVIAYEAGSAAASIEGVMVYHGDETKGIRLWDAAHHGFTSTSFASNHNWRSPFARLGASPTPDLAIVGLGYNDQTSGITPALFKTNIETILTKLREFHPQTPVVLVAWPARSGATTYPWSDYVTAMREIASAQVLTTLLDLQPLVPADWLSTYTTDGTHPNDAGYALVAGYLRDFTLPR